MHALEEEDAIMSKRSRKRWRDYWKDDRNPVGGNLDFVPLRPCLRCGSGNSRGKEVVMAGGLQRALLATSQAFSEGLIQSQRNKLALELEAV